MGVNVNYMGIDTIRLEIPKNPVRIPLTQYNDFNGCVIVVKNTSNNTYLFDKKIIGTPIDVDKRLIDKGDFSSVNSLKRGKYLLWIEDENLWVAKRKGHSYGHKRKDILLIENGKAKNSVVMPYNNTYSKPACKFFRLSGQPLVISNLTVDRDPGSTFLTHITLITGNDDVKIKNVTIHTPMSKLQNDRGFRISACTNVTFENVRIEGSYSQKNHSGYGVFLDNIWNFRAIKMYGKANWGIFGNNNINTAKIEDSQINRFDIHCYGRDISFENVEFFDLYNQYSSTYGTISYKNCTFTNFTPVLNGGSYNSFVEHEVVFKDCVFNATADKYFLFKLSHLDEPANARHELAEKCLPNVSIKNMMVNMAAGAKEFLLFRCSAGAKELKDVGGLTKIDINGLTISTADSKPMSRVTLSNVKLQTKKTVEVNLNGNLNDNVEIRANMPLKGGKVRMRNVKNLKQ